MSIDKNATVATLAALLQAVDTLYPATSFDYDKVVGPALTTAYQAIAWLANDNSVSWDAVRTMSNKMMRGEAQDAMDIATAATLIRERAAMILDL